MSDPTIANDPVPDAAFDQAELRQALAETILETPGVLRIEPTLLGLAKTYTGVGDGPGRHLHLRTRQGLADISVNVAVSSAQPARLLAHQLRALITDALVDRGLVPGAVDVGILAIEPIG